VATVPGANCPLAVAWCDVASRCSPKRQPECSLGIEGIARFDPWKYPDNSRHVTRHVRVQARVYKDGLKLVPTGCKCFIWDLLMLSDRNLFTALTTAKLSHYIFGW
jgi:hypothetical protein